MNLIIKNTIIIFGVILAVLGLVFGSFMPYFKAKFYVRAVNNLSSVKTLEDFRKNFDTVFNFYSLIGNEEVARFLGDLIYGNLAQSNYSENIAREMVNYIEPRLVKNSIKSSLSLAGMYQILWRNHNRPEDFSRAENYLKEALVINPKSPQALYSLFNLYSLTGQKEKTKEIGETIIKYWPEDEKIKNSL